MRVSALLFKPKYSPRTMEVEERERGEEGGRRMGREWGVSPPGWVEGEAAEGGFRTRLPGVEKPLLHEQCDVL